MAGSAYIFKKNANDTWTQIQKLITSSRDSLDRFTGQGSDSISMNNNKDLLCISAPFDKLNNTYTGFVYFFIKGTDSNGNELWTEDQTKTIKGEDEPNVAGFGYMIKISNDKLFVTHNYSGLIFTHNNVTYNNSGKIYYYKINGDNTVTRKDIIVQGVHQNNAPFGYNMDVDSDGNIYINSYTHDSGKGLIFGYSVTTTIE